MAKVVRGVDDYKKEFLSIFNSLCGRHGRWEVWSDFIQLTAIDISNVTDKGNAPKRAADARNIAKKYSEDEIKRMAEMLMQMVYAIDENPDQDFLGELYMACNLGNDHAGQFFTPYNVCQCMSEITYDVPALLDGKGFIAVNDPACGAGALLLSFANACKRHDINYQQKVLFVAQDIDYTVGLMCYISKYLNIVQNGRAYSLPGVDPAANMNFDQARSYCEAKGDGWHCMTRMEWGLLMRICEMQGFIPLGNNNYGKHSSEQFYKAIPTFIDTGAGGKTGRTATGTGPLTWYHDNSPSGIADPVGDVWEWAGGVRTVYGELQVMANNNGADADNSQGVSSTKWMAISADDGSYITPDGSGTTANSVKLDIVSGHIQWSKTITTRNKDSDWPSCSFAAITCDSTISDAAKLVLQCLGMLPYKATDLCAKAGHQCWFRNLDAERAFYSGGNWYNSSYGLASFNGNDPRSDSWAHVGFRAAFVKLPTA